MQAFIFVSLYLLVGLFTSFLVSTFAYTYGWSKGDRDPAAFFSIFFWPLALPLIVGCAVYRKIDAIALAAATKIRANS